MKKKIITEIVTDFCGKGETFRIGGMCNRIERNPNMPEFIGFWYDYEDMEEKEMFRIKEQYVVAIKYAHKTDEELKDIDYDCHKYD